MVQVEKSVAVEILLNQLEKSHYFFFECSVFFQNLGRISHEHNESDIAYQIKNASEEELTELITNC